MKKCLTLLILLFYYYEISAIENPRAGARALALSDAVISLSDIWGPFHNQAGITRLQSLTAAVFYSSPFGLNELAQMAATIILPTGTGTFGLSYFQYGTAQFKETKAGLAFAKKLGSRLSAGIQIDYFSSRFPENKRAGSLATFEAGTLYKVSEKLNFGIHVFNPLKQEFNALSGKVKLPASLRSGVSFQISDLVLLCFETEKTGPEKPRLKTGAEFLLTENLFVRFGLSGEPFLYSSGIGYRVNKLSANIGFNYHGNLGITPSVSIQYNLK